MGGEQQQPRPLSQQQLSHYKGRVFLMELLSDNIEGDDWMEEQSRDEWLKRLNKEIELTKTQIRNTEGAASGSST